MEFDFARHERDFARAGDALGDLATAQGRLLDSGHRLSLALARLNTGCTAEEERAWLEVFGALDDQYDALLNEAVAEQQVIDMAANPGRVD